MAELEDEILISPADIAYTIGWIMNTHRRMYDVLVAILATHSPDKAKELYDMHERGEFIFPPPWVGDGE
jgi:hypothetical protein